MNNATPPFAVAAAFLPFFVLGRLVYFYSLCLILSSALQVDRSFFLWACLVSGCCFLLCASVHPLLPCVTLDPLRSSNTPHRHWLAEHQTEQEQKTQDVPSHFHWLYSCHITHRVPTLNNIRHLRILLQTRQLLFCSRTGSQPAHSSPYSPLILAG